MMVQVKWSKSSLTDPRLVAGTNAMNSGLVKKGVEDSIVEKEVEERKRQAAALMDRCAESHLYRLVQLGNIRYPLTSFDPQT